MDRHVIGNGLAAVLAAVALGVHAQAAPGRDAQGRLVGADGRALYVYDGDTVPGRSACTGPCAAVWPPCPAPAGVRGPDGLGVIARDDGCFPPDGVTHHGRRWIKPEKAEQRRRK